MTKEQQLGTLAVEITELSDAFAAAERRGDAELAAKLMFAGCKKEVELDNLLGRTPRFIIDGEYMSFNPAYEAELDEANA